MSTSKPPEPIPDPTDGAIKLIKVDGETGDRLTGAVFGVYDASSDVLVCELTTDANGEAISPPLTQGGYYLLESAAPDGYGLSTERIDVVVIADEMVVITVTNAKTPEPTPDPIDGTIKLIKVDSETGEKLTDAVFGVYTVSGDIKVCELTTDENGEAVTPLLTQGGYYLLETSAPDGYELSAERIDVTVIADETVEVTVTNDKTPEPDPTNGKIKLIKIDGETGSLLSNAVFDVYDASSDVLVCELTTDENGEAVSPLLTQGGYYLLEITAPDEYELRIDRIDVTVIADETVIITVENDKTPEPTPDPDPTDGRIKLIKTDSVTGIRLSGAVFGVYRVSDDIKVCELTTDANGEAVSPLLTQSGYYLKELSSPAGYELNADKIGVTIKADETVVITVTNVKTPEPTPQPQPTEGRIKLIKTDSITGNRLSGAVFGVYTVSADVKVCELTTDIYGEAVTPLLPKGDYYLKELSAPAGYELSADKIGVTVKADETVVITVTNVKTPEPTPQPQPTDGRIRLIKTDSETGKRLSGAVFGVYRVSDNVKVCDLTTDIYGEAVSPLLPKGDYYLKELSAPSGYELSADKYGVTVKADNITAITVTNTKTSEPVPTPTDGRIKLIKVDGETGKRLSRAVFGVYTVSSGIKVCELTTDVYGEAYSPLLTQGNYYLLELKSPAGYGLSTDKYGVTVKADNTAVITISNKKSPVTETTPEPQPEPDPTPTPEPNAITGELLIVKKAEQTGNPLHGAVFGVYRVSDNTKITELTTDTDGKVSLILEPGEYYLKELRAPYGYQLETAKIYCTVTVGATVKVEVTNIRDMTIIDGGIPGGGITIPKTSIDFPAASYTLAGLLWGIALLCGVLLFRRRKMIIS